MTKYKYTQYFTINILQIGLAISLVFVVKNSTCNPSLRLLTNYNVSWFIFMILGCCCNKPIFPTEISTDVPYTGSVEEIKLHKLNAQIISEVCCCCFLFVCFGLFFVF